MTVEKPITNIGINKSLHLLKDYNFPKNKYFLNTKGEVYIKKNNLYKKMKPFTTKLGYIEYVLTEKDGTKKHIQGHRLVGLMFIPNPENKPHVNHKDTNRSNNVKSNLEWTTISENNLHAYKNGKVPHNKK